VGSLEVVEEIEAVVVAEEVPKLSSSHSNMMEFTYVKGPRML